MDFGPFLARLAAELGPIEWVAAGVTLVSVILCMRAVLSYFPVALVSVFLYFYVFLQFDLKFNAGLQVLVYFPLLVIGWWHWMKGGPKQQDDLPIRRQGAVGNAVCVAVIVLGTWLLPRLLTPGEPETLKAYADAGTTVASVVGQYLLTRKYVENWIVWVVVDAVCCFYLFPSQGMWATTLLYFILLILAVVGWVKWTRAQRVGAAHA